MMKLSQTLSQLLVEYADRPLPLHVLLKQARNGVAELRYDLAITSGRLRQREKNPENNEK